jgi:acetolactate synthase-1/2/3 large subunit
MLKSRIGIQPQVETLDHNFDQAIKDRKIAIMRTQTPRQLPNALDRISEYSKKSGIFTVDAGTSAYAASQALRLKKDQRTIIPGCTLTMGYNLPALIGICAAEPRSRIICITGDGSFQLNIHELQTIVHHKIPSKIFITNNRGYLAIRTTQRNFFQGRFIGEGPRSGVSFPDTEKIAKAYGIKFFRIENNRQLNQTILKALNLKGPVICEIICSEWQDVLTVSSKKLPYHIPSGVH